MENQDQKGISHYPGILLLPRSERDPVWVRAWFVVEVRAESVVEGEWAVEELLDRWASARAPIAGNKEIHQAGQPCYQRQCPLCGARMRRE